MLKGMGEKSKKAQVGRTESNPVIPSGETAKGLIRGAEEVIVQHQHMGCP